MAAKIAVITGATSGIGTEIARRLARENFKVIIGCRTAQSGESTLANLHRSDPASIITFRDGLELTDLDAVYHWADKLKRELERDSKHISVLVCNAGIMHHPFQLTKDGFETHMQVNHLSHHLIIRELENLLKGGRVVFTSSALYKGANGELPLLSKSPEEPSDYVSSKGVIAYAQSKMAMNRCAIGLTSQMPETDFILTSPGVVRTNLTRYMADRSYWMSFLVTIGWHGIGRLFLHSPESGAKPGFTAATDLTLKSGSYLTQKGLEELTTECLDQKAITECLAKSDDLISPIRNREV